MSTGRTSIALFTRDLRVHDNPVLHAAATAERCIPLFVVDDAIGRAFGRPNRAAFLAGCLEDLDRGGALVVRKGNPLDELLAIVRRHDVGEVHLAADVSKYARQREDALAEHLGELGVDLHVHDTVTAAVAPLFLTPTGGKDHFAVFTPYFRKWASVPRRAAVPRPDVPGAARGWRKSRPQARDVVAA